MPTEDYIKWWFGRGKYFKNILLLFHWYLWCGRNKKILEERPVTSKFLCHKIISNQEILKITQKPQRDISKRQRLFEFHYPAGFFDGAFQNLSCGCGAWLMLSPTCHYKIHWNRGRGTNTRAETIALWGLLWFSNQLYLEKLWVYGDSKILIDHLNNKSSLNPSHLTHWLERIYCLKINFEVITLCHVYREKNRSGSSLKKRPDRDLR